MSAALRVVAPLPLVPAGWPQAAVRPGRTRGRTTEGVVARGVGRTAGRRRGSALRGDLRDSAVENALLAADARTATPAELLAALSAFPGSSWNARKVARALAALVRRGRARRAAYGQYASTKSDTHPDTQGGKSDTHPDIGGVGGVARTLRLDESYLNVSREAAAAVFEEVSGSESDSETASRTLSGVLVTADVFERLVRHAVRHECARLQAEVDRLGAELARLGRVGAEPMPRAPASALDPELERNLDRGVAERRREKEAAIAAGKARKLVGSWADWEEGVRSGFRANPEQLRRTLARAAKREAAETAKATADRVKADAAAKRADTTPRAPIDPEALARMRARTARVGIGPKVQRKEIQ